MGQPARRTAAASNTIEGDVTGLRQRSPVTSPFDARPDGAVPGSDGRRVGRSCAIQPRAVPLKIVLTFINISAILPLLLAFISKDFNTKKPSWITIDAAHDIDLPAVLVLLERAGRARVRLHLEIDQLLTMHKTMLYSHMNVRYGSCSVNTFPL